MIVLLGRVIEYPALVVHPVGEWSWEENLDMYRKLIPAGIRTGVKLMEHY